MSILMNQLLAWEIMDKPFYSFLNKPTIIEYNATYYSQVYNLYHVTYREIAMNVPSVQSYIRKSIKNTFSVDSHEIRNPEKNRLWLALNTYNEVIGMIGLRIVADDCYEVQKLVVAKNYRRHGISKILWEKMEKEGSKLCPKHPLRICLSTISLLEVAESYYEKQGFQQIRKDHYDGYDLDIYEKIYSSSVYKTNTIILRNQKHHFHYYTSNHKATYD